MKTRRTLLVAGALSAIVLSAPLAKAVVPPPIIINLTGAVRILQGVPCGGLVDVTTPVAGGRMQITPTTVVREGVVFDLTRLELFVTPFTVRHDCHGISATAEFREIGLQLAGAVIFTGEAVGGPEDRIYRFSIPKEQFLIFESILDNAEAPQPEMRYQRTSEDVTGLIDLRRGTVQLHTVIASRLRFRAGCVRNRCIIDEERRGTQTADISGVVRIPGADTDRDGVPDATDNCPLAANPTQSPVPTPVITPPPNVTLNSCQDHNIGTAQARDVCNGRPVVITNNAPANFAVGQTLVTWSGNDGIDPIVTTQQTVSMGVVDTTPPAVSCTAAHPPGRVQASAADDCGGPLTIRLGTYRLGNGEVIQIQETGRPGVRLLGTVGAEGFRHFQVGRGEGIVMATDAAGNVAGAVCR